MFYESQSPSSIRTLRYEVFDKYGDQHFSLPFSHFKVHQLFYKSKKSTFFFSARYSINVHSLILLRLK